MLFVQLWFILIVCLFIRDFTIHIWINTVLLITHCRSVISCHITQINANDIIELKLAGLIFIKLGPVMVNVV